ncbi:MAG: carbon-nitrogen hydrolase family protein [Dehalococcoidia bacterium]|nr:MAG: carbon-nitrogen hydrolase family protein [Dehalococcoidia bacterium]
MSISRTARVALLQLPAYSSDEAEASLAHTLRRIDETARERPDIIVLPEVTYPAYFIGTTAREIAGVLAPAEAMARFATKAREHGVYIAAGMALDDGRGGWANGAALFDRRGALAGTYAKSFLWHFDGKWFSRGERWPVFETDFGRIGMLICADGRTPEIARSLVLNGAQIVLDLTAWVSGGRSPEQLSTIQREFLMPARAAENGVWVAAADKCGIEAESIVYCGRSCFIDPRGTIVKELGPEDDAALVMDVPLADAAPPVERRPELYSALVEPTDALPVTAMLAEPIVIADQQRYVAAVQMAMPPTGAEFLVAARRHVERLALHDAGLVLFPATPSRVRRAYVLDEVLDGMRRIAADAGVLVAFVVWAPDGEGYRTMYLVGPEGTVGAHRQTHKPGGPRFASMPVGDDVCGVFETPIGRIGMMLSAEGVAPEVARSLMLRGAEIILWAADDPSLPMAMFARARAEENAVFVACAAAPSATGATMIVDPTGRPLATALEGRELAVGASVNRALSHIKQRAPGTDVVRGRQPEAYGELVAGRGAAARMV